MRRIGSAIFLCLLVLLLMRHEAFSQPTLTAANNNPVPGDVFKVYDSTLPLFTTIQLAGPGQTWDFSGVTAFDSTTYTYIDASTTPYYNLVPSATVAIYYPSQSFYNYYSGTANDFSYLGGTSGNPNGIYADPYKYYEYPFTYLNSFEDTFITSSSVCYSTHVADAYGDLVLPFGNVNNVLRHYEHTEIYAATDTTLEDFYYWLLPGTHWSVCTYGVVYNSSGLQYNFFNYLVPSTTGIEQASKNPDMDVYPNPFSSELKINLLNRRFTSGIITIQNAVGQLVFSEAYTESTPSGSRNIDLRSFPQGIYMLELNLDGDKICKRIVKQ